MKRSIIFLVSAIVIFVFTLAVSDKIINDEVQREADHINELLLQDAAKTLDKSFAMREHAVHSFLSGLFNYEIKSCGNQCDTIISASDDDLKGFDNYVYDILQYFLKINPKISSAMFIIEPSAHFGHSKNGFFAPVVTDAGEVKEDIAELINPLNAPTYNRVKKNKRCVWVQPEKGSRLYGKAMLYYVPIYRLSGEFLGLFSISVNKDYIRGEMERKLSFDKGGSSLTLIDNSLKVLVSTNKEHEKCSTINELKEKYYDVKSVEEVFDNGFHHNSIVTKEGEKHFIYYHPLTTSKWTILAARSEKSVYGGVWELQAIFFVIALIGTILMLLCCYILFRQIKKSILQKAAVEEEVKMAEKVQMTMLKSGDDALSEIPHQLFTFIHPAKHVGGDLYDYTVTRDGKLIFCIGDVSGKGMPAALFMTQVVSLFRHAVRQTSSPSEITSQINDVISQNNPDMTFCTFFVGVLDGATITYCNAGHNPPVIISSGKAEYMKVRPNLAMGLFEGYPYMQDSITLTEGQSLLLYTDGVTEAKNNQEKDFGEKRLVDVLSQSQDNVIDTVLDAVHAFVGNHEQSDDITLVYLRK